MDRLGHGNVVWQPLNEFDDALLDRHEIIFGLGYFVALAPFQGAWRFLSPVAGGVGLRLDRRLMAGNPTGFLSTRSLVLCHLLILVFDGFRSG
jgi:hypothetical protein